MYAAPVIADVCAGAAPVCVDAPPPRPRRPPIDSSLFVRRAAVALISTVLSPRTSGALPKLQGADFPGRFSAGRRRYCIRDSSCDEFARVLPCRGCSRETRGL